MARKIWQENINQLMTDSQISKIMKIVKQRIEDQETQIWLDELHNDSGRKGSQKNKLRTYRTFKTLYKQEEYLSEIKDIKHRISFTKLRISDHCLEIERGRYTRPYTIPEDRICKLCNNGIEDEMHFLLVCSFYASEREELFTKLINRNKHFNLLNTNNKFEYIMNATKSNQNVIAKYIHRCFQKKEQQMIT